MEKVTLWAESQVSHVGQIITGFLMLQEQGLDLKIINQVKGPKDFFHGMPMIRAEYRGKRIIYDVGDGYNIPDDIQFGLDHCDFYFKRSFLQKEIGKCFMDMKGKCSPLACISG